MRALRRRWVRRRTKVLDACHLPCVDLFCPLPSPHCRTSCQSRMGSPMSRLTLPHTTSSASIRICSCVTCPVLRRRSRTTLFTMEPPPSTHRPTRANGPARDAQNGEDALADSHEALRADGHHDCGESRRHPCASDTPHASSWMHQRAEPVELLRSVWSVGAVRWTLSVEVELCDGAS